MVIKHRGAAVGALVLSCSLAGYSLAGYGYDNFCYQTVAPMPRASLHCHGKTIPVDKTRNFIAEQLRCSDGSHTTTREPVPFDEELWRDRLNTDPGAAQDMLRSLPVPRWRGAVDYQTWLHWSWEDCQLVTSSRCGTDRVCTTKTDDNGKEVERCHEQPRTCYLDIEVHEAEPCSDEQLTYDVQFEQVERGDENYSARLANGYDLLPGEKEAVTVDNGGHYFHSATMLARLLFGEPRNEYRVQPMQGAQYDSGSLICRQSADYHVGFRVRPVKRIRSRSGNAFSLPEGFDGDAIEPLVWNGGGSPVAMRVQDYSSATIKEFARDIGDVFKNIVIRIQLLEKSWLPWSSVRNTVYIREGEGVAETLNALSDSQKVRRSSLWELNLVPNSSSPGKNLYRNYIPWFVYYPARLLFPAESLSYENKLSPGTDYRLSLQVYQRGMSVYHQACEDDPDSWDCQFYAGWGWLSPSRYESGYYSNQSLDIDFTTPGDINERSYWPLFWRSVGMIDKVALAGLVAAGAYKVMSGGF